MIKVVTLTCSFTNTGKYGITAVFKCNVVNQFHNNNGFTNTGTTEKTNFTTFKIRGK